MSEDSKLLEEIVVVGYGYQKKSDIATSVASVKTDEMKSFPAGNVGDMLRGRVAGVNVTSSSGQTRICSYHHHPWKPFYQCTKHAIVCY